MTVIVDTNVLYAEYDTDANDHDTATVALDTVYDGALGQPYISDYIFDETVTVTRARAGSFGPAKRIGGRLLGEDPYPNVYELLWITKDVFDESFVAFERYADHDLSFTDATIVALVERHDLDSVLSFDDDFDGIIPRTDPHDLAS